MVKNGTSRGKQRYWCRNCGATFHSAKKRYYDDSVKQRAMTLALEGKSARDIAERMDVSHSAVWEWVNNDAHQLAARLRGIAWQLEQSKSSPRILTMEQLPHYMRKTKLRASHVLLATAEEVVWLRT